MPDPAARRCRTALGRWTASRAGAAAFAALLLVGCAGPTREPAGGVTHHDGYSAAGSALPSAHIHGVALDAAGEQLHLATHDGLFRYDGDGYARVGPVVDLMGFTAAGPNHFYASGHPGPGADLPNPVGLIESEDGGKTWRVRSRAGTSDFHTLVAHRNGLLGFDGVLRATRDGRTWTDLGREIAPFALASSGDGRTVLATTETGPARSTDGGRTWSALPGAPLLMLASWGVGDTVVGVTPDGVVAGSSDAGRTWERRGAVRGRPSALTAAAGAAGELRVVVVTSTEVLESTDGGATFAPYGAD